MDRTRAAHLIPGDLAGDEADQVEDLSQRDPGADLGEVNAWHGGDPHGRVLDRSASERVPVAVLRWEQRRGTRTQRLLSLDTA
jgi:hypothetical protein